MTAAHPSAAPRTPGALRALYDLELRLLLTRGRVAALAALGLVGVLVGLMLRAGDATTEDRLQFLNGYGLALVLPVTTLVFASAALGDLVDDQTMVYLWLRPVARWKLGLAAVLATLTVVVPLVVIPLLAAGVAADVDGDAMAGLLAATAVGAIGYTGAFTALGLRARRALVWGLIYIFIWEQFVARAGEGVRRFALSAYTRSVLGHISGVELRDADISRLYGLVVPLAVGVAGALYVARRLQTQDVA